MSDDVSNEIFVTKNKRSMTTVESAIFLKFTSPTFSVNSMQVTSFPSLYLFKVNTRNSRKLCEIYSKLTIRTPERHQ